MIRRALITDIESITYIYNQAIIQTVATFDLDPKTLEDRKLWFEAHSDQYPIFVAEVNGQVAGFISLSELFAKKAYNGTSELSIYIDEKYRKKGIGNGLMEKLLEYVQETKCCHTIISRIAGENEISIKLHKKFGFQLTGTLKEVGYKFNRYIDVHFYQWL